MARAKIKDKEILDKVTSPEKLTFGHLQMLDNIAQALLDAKTDDHHAWHNLSKLVDVHYNAEKEILITLKVHKASSKVFAL